MADIDEIRKWSDRRLKEIEEEISEIYTEAVGDITKKWSDYMEKSEAKIADLRIAYNNAVQSNDTKAIREARDKLQDAIKSQTLRNNRYKDLVDEITTKLGQVNQNTITYINGQMPEIYVNNFNFIDKETQQVLAEIHMKESFTLIDKHVIERRIKDGDIKLPKKKMSIPADKRWNTKQLNSQVLQGILQGESMDKIAKRILSIVNNNRNAAIRNARTMVTGAENQGRVDRYKDLEDKGIVLKKVWIATGDGRTRDWHLEIDGQEVEVDEPFIDGNGNKLDYPGDPSAEPETVYNCRCSMRSHVVGFRKNDGSVSYINYEHEGGKHKEEIEDEKVRRKR